MGLGDLEATQLVMLATVAAVSLLLQLAALYQIWWGSGPKGRGDYDRWIWTAVVLLTNGIGALVYLLAGRAAKAESESVQDRRPPVQQGAKAEAAVELLYGKGREEIHEPSRR